VRPQWSHNCNLPAVNIHSHSRERTLLTRCTRFKYDGDDAEVLTPHILNKTYSRRGRRPSIDPATFLRFVRPDDVRTWRAGGLAGLSQPANDREEAATAIHASSSAKSDIWNICTCDRRGRRPSIDPTTIVPGGPAASPAFRKNYDSHSVWNDPSLSVRS
jgi:hypothetical protein